MEGLPFLINLLIVKRKITGKEKKREGSVSD
jgi:hypothetical protein